MIDSRRIFYFEVGTVWPRSNSSRRIKHPVKRSKRWNARTLGAHFLKNSCDRGTFNPFNLVLLLNCCSTSRLKTDRELENSLRKTWKASIAGLRKHEKFLSVALITYQSKSIGIAGTCHPKVVATRHRSGDSSERAMNWVQKLNFMIDCSRLRILRWLRWLRWL